MATEIKKVLEVDTGKSTKSIKELRDEIKKLKTEYESAEIGSEKFERASNDLAIAQADLKTALVDGKKATDNAEGSYNHLVATMAELKKQWRATADEVKRNELGKQIDSINDRLKGMDSSIGNNQRLVGSYAEEFKKALNEQQDATIATKTKLESLQKVTSGLASGYAALQGVTALLGIENENLEKTFVKVQSAMAIAQGVGGLKDLVEGLGNAKVAFADNIKGVKAFITGLSGVKKAIAATGMGLLVVAIGALVGKWMEWKDAQEKAEEKAKMLREEQEKQIKTLQKNERDAVVPNIVKLKQLADTYKNLGDNINSKKKFIKENTEELSKMGIQITNINDADKVFITNTDDYVNALMARAKAQALEKTAIEEYTKFYQFKQEKLGNLEQQKNNGNPYAMSDNAQAAQQWETQIGIAEQLINREIEIEENKITETLTNIFKEIKKFKDEANKLLNFGTTSTTDVTDEIAEIRNELYLKTLDNEEREIKILEQSYAKKIKLAEKDADFKKQLEEQLAKEILDIRTKYLVSGFTDDNVDVPSIDTILKLDNKELNNNYDTGSYKTDKANINSDLDSLKYNYDLQLATLKSAKENELITEEEYNNRKLQLQEEYTSKSGELINQLEDKEKQVAQNSVAVFTSVLSSTSAIISEIQAGIDTTTKEGFERNKKLQIANATIQMLAGITTALAGTFTTKSGVWDMVLAGIQAATIATTGAIQIANIKKTTFNGNNSTNFSGLNTSSPAAVPNITTSVPMTQVRNIQTDAEIAEMNKAQKVYVLESDITTAQKRVEVRENNASF